MSYVLEKIYDFSIITLIGFCACLIIYAIIMIITIKMLMLVTLSFIVGLIALLICGIIDDWSEK